MDETPPKRKPHLSVTQMETVAKCGEIWRRSYEEKEKIPPGFAAVKGRAVHSAAEVNWKQKIQSHTDMPVKDIVDLSASLVTNEIHAGISLMPSETGIPLSVLKGRATDDVVKMARLHAMVQAPLYQPTKVEESIRVNLPNCTHDLLTVLDMADDKHRVVDLKTTGKAMKQDDADDSIQLTAYHLAYEAQTGVKPTDLLLEVMVNGATTVKRQRLSTTRDMTDINVLGARFNATLTTIKSGVFAPAPIGSWYCSPKYCGYWTTCPFVNHSKRRQGD